MTPDPKSGTAWDLATHLADTDIWFLDSINGKFEWDPERVKQAEAQFKSVDGNFNWPAVQYIGFATNHSMHHRGQLAAYLRAMGSRVPNICGPSADDKE